jgi:exonuclease III
MTTPLRIATVNVNGVRAAFRKGMGDWLQAREVDILALQEVRASTEDLENLLGPEWNILHDAATAKGRAGVALASRGVADIHRVELGAEEFDSAGRWLEADYRVGARTGPGLGWVDVGRTWAGEVDGPYTWWSQRGQAFDTDTGWRLDYHVATPELASTVTSYTVDRASAWDTRWSDHAPVVADYVV